MKKSIITIFIIIMAHSCVAGYRIYGGSTFSKLNTNNSRIRINNSFGIDKTWDTKFFSTALGLRLIIRSTYKADNIMVFGMTNHGYYFDALFSAGYLEVPLMVILPIYTHNSIKISFTVGPSVGIHLLDNSKKFNTEYFEFEQNPELRQTLENYYMEADELYPNKPVFLNTGIMAEYKNMYIEARYNHGLSELGELSGLVMKNEKFRTLEIVFGIYIRNRN